jgi:hypothetical protein
MTLLLVAAVVPVPERPTVWIEAKLSLFFGSRYLSLR